MQVNQLLSYCRDVSESGRRNASSAYRYMLQGTRAAFVATTVALAVILLTGSTFQPTAYTLFLGAIILSAYHGGVYAGILSLVLSTFFLLCLHFVTPATQTFSSLDMAASVILLSLAGLLACFLASECQGGARKLDEQRRNLLYTREGLIVLDEMLRVKHINQAAQALTGWTERDALNRSLENVAGLSADQSGQALRVPWASLLTGQAGTDKASGSAVLVTRDGKERYVDYWVEIVSNAENGKDACFYFHDTSERRENDERNQRQLEQHRRLAESLPAPFCFLDLANRCVLQNKAWQDLAGAIADDKLVPTLAAKFGPSDAQFAANWAKALRERSKYTTECQVRSGLNPVRHFRFESLPVRNERGEPLGQLCMLLENTQQKLGEAELAKKQQELANLQNLLHQCETEANEQIVALEKAQAVLQQELTSERSKSAGLTQQLDLLRGEHAQLTASKQELEELARRRLEQLTGELHGSKRATARACQILELAQGNLRTGVICWEKGRQKPIVDRNANAMLELPVAVDFGGNWSEYLQVMNAEGTALLEEQATPFALAQQMKPFRDLEVQMKTRAGTTLTLLTSGAVLHDENQQEHGFALVLRDVTEQKRSAFDRDAQNIRWLEVQQELNQERLLVKQQAARIDELTVVRDDLEQELALQQAEFERRRIEEEARRAEDERQRLEDEARRTEEANRRRLEEEARQAEEARRRAEDEARQRAEEEARQAAEAARRAEEDARRAEEEARQNASRLNVSAPLQPAAERAVAFARRLADQVRDLSNQLCKQSEREHGEQFRQRNRLRLQQLNVLAESLRSTLRVPEKAVERLEPVEIAQVVNNVVNTWKRVLHASTRQLVVALPSKPIWLVGSSELLSLATEILVDIACHNSASGAYIELSLSKGEESVILSVKDKGRGFSDPELDYLRRGTASAEKPDAGLDALRAGIAFVTSLAELHEGQLEMESGGVGKGCIFRLLLPHAANAEQPLRLNDWQSTMAKVG